MRKILVALPFCAGLAGCDLGYEGALADCRASAVKQATCQTTDQQCVAQRSQLVATCMAGKNFFLGDSNEVAAAMAVKKTDRATVIMEDSTLWHRNAMLDYINAKRMIGR